MTAFRTKGLGQASDAWEAPEREVSFGSDDPDAAARPGPGGGLGPLDSPELSVKYFVEDSSAVRVEELIPVFHRWIRESVLEDELLIDVANYAHVPKGPGVMLICNLGQYGLDLRHGRPGLRYRRRRVAYGNPRDQLAGTFRSAIRAAILLEDEPTLEGRYRFRTDEVQFVIYDRLLAPSAPGTLEAVRPLLDSFLRNLYQDQAISLELTSQSNEPFAVRIATPEAPPLPTLLGRL